MAKETRFMPAFLQLQLVLSTLKKIPYHWIVPAIFLFGAGYYLMEQWEFTERLMQNSPAAQAQRAIEEYAKNNPRQAASILHFQDKLDAVPLRMKINVDERLPGDVPGYLPLTEGAELDRVPPDLALLQIAHDSGLFYDDAKWSVFLESYLELFSLENDQNMQSAVLAQLKESTANQEVWAVVQNSPFDLLVAQSTLSSHPDLWAYYAAKRASLYGPLHDAIGMAAYSALETDEEIDIPGLIQGLITTHRQHEPLIRKYQAAFQPNVDERNSEDMSEFYDAESAIVLHLLQQEGDVVNLAVNQLGMPLEEVLGVLRTSAVIEVQDDDLLGLDNDAEAMARQLHIIYQKSPAIWEAAQEYPFAIDLWQDAPQNAEKVITMFGDNPLFIPQLYEVYDKRDNEGLTLTMAHVAEALVRYDTQAAWILNEYRDNEQFHALLANPEVGWRVVGLVAHEPARLNEAHEDPRWVARFVDEKGERRRDEHTWELIPLTGPIKVLKNYRDGVPNTWEEIGWAAFDSLTIPLVFVTAPTNLAAKGTSSTYRALRGARATKVASQARAFSPVSQNATRVLSSLSRAFPKAVAIIKASAQQMYNSGAQAFAAIQRLSAQQYRVVWRNVALVAAFRLYMRPELLKDFGRNTGEFAGRGARNLVDQVSKAVVAAVREVMPEWSNRLPTFFAHFFFVAVLLGCAVASFFMLRPRGPQPA